MYLTPKNNKYYVLDIEANSLKPDTIWCACLKKLDTGEEFVFTGKKEFNEWHNKENVYIGHNILSYDAVYLNLLWDTDIDLGNCIDTYTLSLLYNPALDGGHSLEAWGQRLKSLKIDFSDWSKLSDEMILYCKQDVSLTHKLYKALTDKMLRLGYSELSAEIEHKIRVIINQQERNGFFFNRLRAEELYSDLTRKQSDLSKSIHSLFPPTLELVKRCPFRRNKDGSLPSRIEKARNRYHRVDVNETEGFYDCYDYSEFNIGSPKQRVEKLLSLGWEPQKFTEKGFPKVDEDALVAFSDVCGREEVKAIAEWLVLQGRSSMIKTWLDNLGSDSRIHGRVNSCGCKTRRMSHSSPNTSNIPSAAKAKYGHECRALWGVEPGRGLVLVGYDAAGLETAGLCHYLNNKRATEILLRPKPEDIHSANARRLSEALGWPCDREAMSKTCVPLDTKALTRRGWKHYNELIIGEEILGYNSETKKKEWTTLKDITTYNDEVYEIGNSYRKFKATGNHRWFVRQRKKGLKSWSKINGSYMVDEIRTTNELNSESSIILNAPFNEDQDKIPSNIDWVKNQKYGIDWEQRVLDMSHSERKQFLQGFLLADGHIVEQDHWAWSQNKNELAEALILCSYLVNDGQIHVSERNGTNDEMYTVTLSKKGHITCSRLTKESLGIQPVWCPTTDLGSWVMRQGNEITITGNCWYAWLYGAYPPKLGSIVRASQNGMAEAKAGEIVVETFFRNVPGLKELINEVQYEFRHNHGLLETIDGGFVRSPSLSDSLNYRIQSLGAILMKLASIILDETCKEKGIRFKLVGSIHDEGQLEVEEQYAEDLGKTAVWSIEEAGRRLKLNVPVTGDFKIGKDWSQTH